MKNINDFFRDFLKDEVNLNPTRLEVAKAGIKTMENFLRRNDLFKDSIIDITPQGSYRQETIIKPFGDSDFDVDLLISLRKFDGWEPKDYLNNLHQEFKSTIRYADLVDRRGKSRCVTIDYANDFHIDLVPSISIYGVGKVMNKNSNEFEDTDGDSYAQWFEKKNLITTNQYLTKVVRLVKYLRDSKLTFSIKSVLLTSLIGRQVNEYDNYFNPECYKNLSTSLKTLFNRLNDYLQNRPNLTDEILVNPVLPTEFFNRHWNQDRYSNFRNKISNYNTWINDAYEESDINEAVKKWRKIFGEDFGEIQKTMASFSAYQSFDVKASRHDSRINQEEFISEQFPMNLDDRWSLKIAVSPDRSSGGFRPYVYRKNEGLTFMVNRNKSNLPQGIFFKWKVKNSGSEAKRYNAMRGQLENDKGDGVKFEWTLYKGKHYVECYAIYRDSVVATDSVYINVV
ncbi:hypothetical protein NIES2135_54920 [Leptolyngbya boryana NIES-2135]|jgi:hypothetical protein|uniref:Adenylyl/Guanylyl and SMODS C-terminal sensor domain-containing protein n=1 Tax=Leptolyngbya boryana NIES-2135 TaxID=1973484 RepID=A0A1Z4JPG7_LEPBY|nr:MULTISPECIES: nucleotidyltransferase [Leptolyngbya]BAY58619.1 hypothetical protein NIES2135_54920 [Leptolyngbya boryana NIES-2135]MBD2370707.1 nucleotidyltransferase [Leptolyngbya sp. FACHB-161]MBD2377140.1 nucleotidyltransferase [Leptolyngbya sp. FACHB-238]MBD2401583.1 nucleotidyltransferase [Leptolyngbya sp. FACHB-239]MBD2408135.1 nucleotidyltransferase [Leptolyngbya sp. FACHB-402]